VGSNAVNSLKKILVFSLFVSFIASFGAVHVSIVLTEGTIDELKAACLSLNEQTYKNWDVIAFIHKLSLQGASDFARWLSSHALSARATLVTQSKNPAPLYSRLVSCKGDVVLVLNSGDRFFDSDSLGKIANRYENGDVWMISSYPYSFRSWLFKRIKIEDVFLAADATITDEKAYMLPLLEMSSRGHVQAMPESLCFNNGKIKSKNLEEYQDEHERRVKSKKAYSPLATSAIQPRSNEPVTIVAFSKDRPMQLYAFLESAYELIVGNYTITVIYLASNQGYEKAYQEVAADFKKAIFVSQKSRDVFKQLTLNAVYQSPGDYVMFAVDDMIVRSVIELDPSIDLLELTGAYSFYFRLGENISYSYTTNRSIIVPPFIKLGPALAWKFAAGQGEWRYPNTLDMALYRKKDIKGCLDSLYYTSPNTFEAEWDNFFTRYDTPLLARVGLCPTRSTIVNVPVNLVQSDWYNTNMNLYSAQELLEKFNQGLKIDVKIPWHKLGNRGRTLTFHSVLLWEIKIHKIAFL
jgi:hypothetical protein